jgi:hypothetical protein
MASSQDLKHLAQSSQPIPVWHSHPRDFFVSPADVAPNGQLRSAAVKLPDYQITHLPNGLIPRSKALSSTIPADTCVTQPPSAVVIFSFHQQL